MDALRTNEMAIYGLPPPFLSPPDRVVLIMDATIQRGLEPDEGSSKEELLRRVQLYKERERELKAQRKRQKKKKENVE
ncbi:hypothetical protein RUND412_000145 [Rhizina undulata]